MDKKSKPTMEQEAEDQHKQRLPALPAAIVLVVENHHHFKDWSSRDSPSSSSSTSSIGTCCDDGELEGEVQSAGPLERMEALESSLPLKRGLSQFFNGKSRSFTSLKEVNSSSSAEDLAKPEVPFNLKRRRLLNQARRIPTSKSSANFKASTKDWSPPRPAIVRVSASFLPRSFSLADVQRNHHHHHHQHQQQFEFISGVSNA